MLSLHNLCAFYTYSISQFGQAMCVLDSEVSVIRLTVPSCAQRHLGCQWECRDLSPAVWPGAYLAVEEAHGDPQR